MRIVVLACVALTGCSGYLEHVRERQQAQQAAEHAYLQTPQGAAHVACQTKVQFAMAGYHDPSFTGLEGMARANQLHASCMDFWRRTGQMP